VLSVEKFSQASALALPVGGEVRCVMASGEDPNHVYSKTRIEELIKECLEINKFRVDFIVKKVRAAPPLFLHRRALSSVATIKQIDVLIKCCLQPPEAAQAESTFTRRMEERQAAVGFYTVEADDDTACHKELHTVLEMRNQLLDEAFNASERRAAVLHAKEEEDKQRYYRGTKRRAKRKGLWKAVMEWGFGDDDNRWFPDISKQLVTAVQGRKAKKAGVPQRVAFDYHGHPELPPLVNGRWPPGTKLPLPIRVRPLMFSFHLPHSPIVLPSFSHSPVDAPLQACPRAAIV